MGLASKISFCFIFKKIVFFNLCAFFEFRNKNYCLDKAAGYFVNKTVYYTKNYLKPENLGLRRLINQVFGFSVCRLIRKKTHGAMRPLYPNFRIKYFFGCCSKQGNTVIKSLLSSKVKLKQNSFIKEL